MRLFANGVTVCLLPGFSWLWHDFFPSFLKLSMRNAWSSLTTPGAISPETRTRLVFEKGDNLGTMPGAQAKANDEVAIGF